MSVDVTESRENLEDFLSKHHVGVIATCSNDGKPYAATVYFTYDKQFNLYFVTKKDTQKNRDLQDNKQAAIAIYDEETQTTVQAQGTVVEVKDDEKVIWVMHDIWNAATKTSASNTPPQTRLNAGGYIMYKFVTPSLRTARFVQKDSSNYDQIFEVVNTQPTASS